MDLPPGLEETLAEVAQVAADASEPWWIIGSAAVALHGAGTGVRDVDLMMGIADARHFLQRVGALPTPDTDHPQFRSIVFGTWLEPPLPVEVFAGFSLANPGGWHPVTLRTRESVSIQGRTLYVPSIDELHDLLLTFGRPKDLERARLLESISGISSGSMQPPDPHRSSS